MVAWAGSAGARPYSGRDPAPFARRVSTKGGARFGLAVLRPPRHQLQKKAFGRPSRIGLMLLRREWHGRTINPSSIPTDWSSSTKPAPQPKWRGCAVGLHAANGWSAKSRTGTGKPPPLLRACALQLSLHHASSTVR